MSPTDIVNNLRSNILSNFGVAPEEPQPAAAAVSAARREGRVVPDRKARRDKPSGADMDTVRSGSKASRGGMDATRMGGGVSGVGPDAARAGGGVSGAGLDTIRTSVRTRRRTPPLFTIAVLGVLVGASILAYLFVEVNPKYFDYVMGLRVPKLLAMLVTAFCIGTATVVFQSVINNTIVTPCLLGMNSLYILVHTASVFAWGSTSFIVTNKMLAFPIDLALMGIAAVLIYGSLFRKAGGNVLYVLLAGTVMATFFTSIATALQRAMDPNEYDALQNSIIAGFNRVNSDILLIAAIAIIAIIWLLRKDLKVLDAITLGKDQAINLGVDYDRVTRRLLIGVALFIATATALVGPISFLGLIIANIARESLKTYRHAYLMVASASIGMVVLIAGQAAIEHLLHYSTTIAVFINVGGGLYFLYLLMRNRSSA